MNENSFLEPQQVIAQSRDAIRILHAENAKLQTAISSALAFIEDDSTSTKGIN